MRVRQDYGVNFMGRDGGILPVAYPPFLLALKEAAVDKHLQALFARAVVARVDEMFRSGYGAGGAEKLKVGHKAPRTKVFLKRTISQQEARSMQPAVSWQRIFWKKEA